MLNKFLRKDNQKRGGYISAGAKPKIVKEDLRVKPGVWRFVTMCVGLLRKRIFSLNGLFNAVILSILWYICVRKQCVLHLVYWVYKRMEKLERGHLMIKLKA